MKTSQMIKELTEMLAKYGDKDLITAQKDKNGEYTYGSTITIVNYCDGTFGLFGYRKEDRD